MTPDVNMGRHDAGNIGKLLPEASKSQTSKTHYGTDATYAARSQMSEAQFSCLQSLVDYIQGNRNFMIGQGIAGQEL